MGYLGNRWAIYKATEGDEGERFIVRYENGNNAHKAGYMFNESGPLTEAQLRAALAEAEGTEADIERVIREARENYQKELTRTS